MLKIYHNIRGHSMPNHLNLFKFVSDGLGFCYGSNEHTQVVSEIWAPKKYSHAPVFPSKLRR